ncbi:N-acetyltransferase family protein [Arsenicicoccus dermatophilus]|uniref:GNAT family N-acetyltransferase n=1 Tax=Arsenicicoccus dermatophilus TaxID=1076331 RepID=UPI003916E851
MSAAAHVRRARPDDAFAVAAMMLQLGREQGAAPDPEFLDGFADAWLRDSGDRPFWLAEVDRRPLGVAGLTLVAGLPVLGGSRRARWGWLDTIYVTSTFRRCGIGGRLAREVHAWSAAEGLTHLRADLSALGPAAPGIARRLAARPAPDGTYTASLRTSAGVASIAG